MVEAVVIFGATGFLGCNLVARLAGKIPKIVAVSRSGAPAPGARQCVAMDRLEDIGALPSDAVVVNVAAQRYESSRFEMAQSEILTANVEIANAVYDFCLRRGVREVRAASSVAVYPDGSSVLDDELPIDLDAAPNVSEAFYAWSKRWGEILAELYRDRYGISTVSFRLSNPYGPHDSIDPAHAHVLPAFVMRALAPGDSFVIEGSPSIRRDFIYVEDVCDVFETSLGWRGRNAAMNLCTGRTHTLRELAETILAIRGDPRPIVAEEVDVRGVAARVSTNSRLVEATGKTQFASLAEGLAPTIAWYADALASRSR
jgi:nucleoside-diphosphate-sugar epimerase